MRGKNYQYISTVPYNATTDYIMGDKRISAFGAPNMIAYNTWEKNRTLDFGLDIAAHSNRRKKLGKFPTGVPWHNGKNRLCAGRTQRDSGSCIHS